MIIILRLRSTRTTKSEFQTHAIGAFCYRDFFLLGIGIWESSQITREFLHMEKFPKYQRKFSPYKDSKINLDCLKSARGSPRCLGVLESFNNFLGDPPSKGIWEVQNIQKKLLYIWESSYTSGKAPKLTKDVSWHL